MFSVFEVWVFVFELLFLSTNPKPTNPKTQHQKIDENISRIAIKNGCGKKRLGLIYQRYLLDLGYDVTETTNAIHTNGEYHFGHSFTKILFHKKNKKSAIYLSNELGIDETHIF